MVMDVFWRFDGSDGGQVEVGANLVENYKEQACWSCGNFYKALVL